jgi:hypothetical protein
MQEPSDIEKLFMELTGSDRVKDVKLSLTNSFTDMEDNKVKNVPVVNGVYKNQRGVSIQANYLFDGKKWQLFGYPG